MFYQVSALVFFATVFTLYQIYPTSPDTLLLSSFALAQLLLLHSLKQQDTQYIDILHYAFALAIPVTIFCAQKKETLLYVGAVVALTMATRWHRQQHDLTPCLFTASADVDDTFTNRFGDLNVQHYFTGCLLAILYRLRLKSFEYIS